MHGNTWAKEHSFDLNNINRLFNAEISYIRIPNFATEIECLMLSDEIKRSNIDFYENFDPPVGKLGVTQYDGIIMGKDFYFNHVEASNKLQNKIFSYSFNPLERIFSKLSEISSFELTIPKEPGYGKYYAGVIREINQSVRVHADFAVYDAPEWLISNVSSQLTWNLYCNMPKIGGECIIYNYLWNIDNDRKLDLNTYQYNLEPLVDCEAKVIKPNAGDLYIFNSRNFHEVTMASSSRLSISSFIGKCDNQLLFWS